MSEVIFVKLQLLGETRNGKQRPVQEKIQIGVVMMVFLCGGLDPPVWMDKNILDLSRGMFQMVMTRRGLEINVEWLEPHREKWLID